MIQFNSKTPAYAWLSNFHPCDVVDNDGGVWRSAEHAYQAMKFVPADLYRASPDDARQRICDCRTAAEAKRLGGSLPGMRAGWNGMKRDVMLKVLRRKFACPVLRRRLLDTGDEDLVHDCPWGDRYWGVTRGEGLNVLGVLLMQVRRELAARPGT